MAKKRIIDMTDEDFAKREEEQNLAGVEKSIDSVIDYYNKRIADLDKKIDNYYVLDQEDREGKREYREIQNYCLNTVDVWKRYKDSPYFGRMDLACNGADPETFFVGKKGIAYGGEIYVLDWRTEVGSAFANKQATRYNIEGNNYKLILRRAVDIKNEEVVSVNTEYDDGSLSLSGDVIDPFLLSVLRDKKRDYKLTDIIRTIQSNQNELIRKPLEESFIVQGCAGSGKTMILLHRLSYIAFNYRDVNFSRFFILTPNEYFNLHVDELSHELGLDKIKRYAVEAFYAAWIRFLGNNDIFSIDTVKKKTVLKVDPVPSRVSSEKLLNNEMLTEVYSKAFYNGVIELYEKHWKTVLDQLIKPDLKSVLQKNGIDISANTSHKFQSYSSLKKKVVDIVSAYSATINAKDKAEADLEKAERQITEKKTVLESETEKIKAVKETFLAELAESETEHVASLEAIKRIKIEVAQTIKKANSDKSAKLSESKAIEESLAIIRNSQDYLAIIRNSREYYQKIDYLRSSDADIANIILERCKNKIEELEKAENQYKNTPVYNFGKRSLAKSDLGKATESFTQSVNSVIDDLIAVRSATLAALRREITELDAAIVEATEKNTAADRDKNTEKKLGSVRRCRNLFALEAFPDIERELKPVELDDLPGTSKDYLALSKSIRKNEKFLQEATRLRNESIAAIKKAEEISLGDFEALKKSKDLIEKLNYTAIYSKLDSALKSVYKKHGQKMQKGVSYRHKLLYKLLLCSLYYEYRADIPYFINIDEAQDLAETEYMLLRRIFGPNAVFNLYGDVNQLVYSYKGITQWDEIGKEITKNIYFLNENYRNTLQITDYCNKEFEAEITGIGLSGERVKEVPFEEAITKLLHIKETTPDCRAAIIYRKGLNTIRDALTDFESAVAVDIVDTKKISVITVEESKGLEFDAVIVVNSLMSMNEKYISYTRALDNLFITDLPGSEITAEENETRAIEEADNERRDNETSPGETDEPSVTSTLSQEERNEPQAELTDEVVNIRVSDAAPYINTFFKSDSNLKALFKRLSDEIKQITPDIMIRVSTRFIGFAKQAEKCRLYVAFENGQPQIKYKHLLEKEDFSSDRYDHYLRAYQQCCQYIVNNPDSILLQKKRK